VAHTVAKTSLDFHPDLPVEIEFDAPHISSDGGALLVAQLDDRLGLCEAVASLVPDERDPSFIEHSRVEQLRQRVFGLMLGYEDQNDAEYRRIDPVFKAACRKLPDGAHLSSQPTLSLFDNAVDDEAVTKMRDLLEFDWVRRLGDDRQVVILDIDSSGFKAHGQQELVAFNGYFDAHSFHPLLVYEGQTGQLVSVRLRPGDASDGADAEADLERIIRRLKLMRPDIAVVVRADAGFAKPDLYRMLEDLDARFGQVGYLIGISKNSVFERKLDATMQQAVGLHKKTGQKSRTFADFTHTAHSWKRARHVAGKAEVTSRGKNPRFVITNLDQFSPRVLYRAYCQRGQAENFVKSFKSHLSADRLSCTAAEANRFRLIMCQLAYRLMSALKHRLIELADTVADDGHTDETSSGDEPTDKTQEDTDFIGLIGRLARAQFDTLRLLLLKVAALVDQSTRRIHVRMPHSFAAAPVFARLAAELKRPPPD
jgi:hypothetical protein